MYTCIIIESDETVAQQLTQFLAKTTYFHPPIICLTGLEGLRQLFLQKIDVLFLDLDLPDISGIELIMALPQDQAVVVTSFRTDQAIDCYEVGVVDFLKKPYDFNRFLLSVGRAIKHNSLTKRKEPLKEVYFKIGRQIERFQLNDILYIEAYGIYSKIHTKKAVVAITKRISDVLPDLDSNYFIRIHKSFIINAMHLKRADQKHILINDTRIPIGTTYRSKVAEFINNLGSTF